MTTKIRLQKLLSEQGICSRRDAEDLIRKGKIKINGQIATLGDRADFSDKIEIKGSVLKLKKPEFIVMAYHKPKGVECTLKEIPGQTTLADIDFGAVRVFPIGRLDTLSRGLLLLTNDGELANRLMHPRYDHKKEYLVTVSKEFSGEVLQKMGRGVIIDGKKTRKCEVEKIMPKIFRIVLREGRNRQIRKMCEAFDLKVVDLVRIQVEKIKLGELPEGKWRILSETEVNSLKKQ